MNIQHFSNRVEILVGDGQTDVINAIHLPVKPTAILSSPIGAAGMCFIFQEVSFPSDLTGIRSYVGHPATRALLEALGAETDSSGVNGNPGRFDHHNLAVGEWFLAVPLASNQRASGWTVDEAISSVKDLKAIRCIRIA